MPKIMLFDYEHLEVIYLHNIYFTDVDHESLYSYNYWGLFQNGLCASLDLFSSESIPITYLFRI